jgi:A/G-specific adenine glycosylase
MQPKQLLLDWFHFFGRDLPWRRTRDPYAILVSEVMLQQTQAQRVIPYYLAWLERWPSAEALAAASPGDAIRAWQGLGYNRRALNLHRAARQVVAHGWPDDLTELPEPGWRSRASSPTSRARCGSSSTWPRLRPGSRCGSHNACSL